MIRLQATTVVEPEAADALVTVADLKTHLRILHASEDDELQILLATAHSYAESVTSSALRRQTLEGALPCFPVGGIDLSMPPLIAVVSVTYIDTDGITRTLDPASYETISRGPIARILWRSGITLPVTADRTEAVIVRWRAGYDPTRDAISNARHAIRLLAGHWYFSREASADERGRTSTPPHSVEALLARYRQVGFI